MDGRWGIIHMDPKMSRQERQVFGICWNTVNGMTGMGRKGTNCDDVATFTPLVVQWESMGQ